MEKKFIPMLLDDKNIMTDALAEELFDDGEYVERVHRELNAGVHVMLGFIGDDPHEIVFVFGSNALCVTNLWQGSSSIRLVEKILRKIMPTTIIERVKGGHVYEGFFKFYEEVEE
jgi:hypothetical protein